MSMVKSSLPLRNDFRWRAAAKRSRASARARRAAKSWLRWVEALTSRGNIMDLKYSPEEEKFRTEVRAFFDAELPTDIRTKLQLGRRISKDDMVRWQKILFRKGWGAPNWPKSFG